MYRGPCPEKIEKQPEDAGTQHCTAHKQAALSHMQRTEIAGGNGSELEDCKSAF